MQKTQKQNKLEIMPGALAFTLAEVLITLGIIGVVAAMTIPTLMNKTNDAEMKSAWKKNYSVFSQATAQMVNDNGGSISGLFTDSDSVATQYSQYLQKSKVCTDAIAEGCRAPIIGLSNNPSVNVVATGPGVVLSDGAYFQPWLGDKDCKQAIGAPVVFYRCAGAIIDVNGSKKPNIIGKDNFEFHILENRILPYGVQGDPWSTATNCTPAGDGEGCGAKYLSQ